MNDPLGNGQSAIAAPGSPPAIPDMELLRQIGKGGFGEVWLARNQTTGGLRAVKIVPLRGTGAVDPAGREIVSLSRLEQTAHVRDPNLATIHHVGTTADHLFYIMDPADDVSGGPISPGTEYTPATLAVRLRGGPARDDDCARWSKQLLSALACLHREGLVHRDVKPSNCLFIDGELKLADFGFPNPRRSASTAFCFACETIPTVPSQTRWRPAMSNTNRRSFLKRTTFGLTLATALAVFGTDLARPAAAGEPIDIGGRRELFVDDFLIASIEGAARQTLHHPTAREVVLVFDRPWEGNGLNYVTIFRDGDLYKMYYRGGDYDRGCTAFHEQVYCYAESRDGVRWERPNLGLVEFGGSKENNIITSEKDPQLGSVCHNFSPFIDRNPAAPASERYKAIGGGPLVALVSPDGIHWTKAAAEPIITFGDFDSHNLAFWDVIRQEYRAYHRKSRNGRDVMTETSATFAKGWTEPVFLEYTPSRGGELYTSQITQYERAPQFYLGFPTRYEDRGLTPSTKYLPQWDYRQSRSALSKREGTAVTEGLFMASRDGRNFRVFEEAFMRPGLRTRDSWFYGDNYQNLGLVETVSAVAPDAPKELSMYLTEGTLQNGKPAKLRRYTLRLDGFVSISATMSGGRLQTKPIRFAGNRLSLNFSSSARGGIRVGLTDAGGQPLAGGSSEDCPWIYGDDLARPVEWLREGKETTDVSAWAGKPVRLVFELRDADLYSFQFD